MIGISSTMNLFDALKMIPPTSVKQNKGFSEGN